MNNPTEPQPLTCDLTAISVSEREEHIVTAPQLFQTAQAVRELPNGYAFRFLNEPGKFLAVAKYIENERLCCPFFDFELKVKPNHGAIWLHLSGEAGAKELLRIGLLENLGTRDDLKKLIQTGGDAKLNELIAQFTFPQLGDVLNKD